MLSNTRTALPGFRAAERIQDELNDDPSLDPRLLEPRRIPQRRSRQDFGFLLHETFHEHLIRRRLESRRRTEVDDGGVDLRVLGAGGLPTAYEHGACKSEDDE